MALKGRVSNSTKKKAKITSTNSAGPQQVSVEVPAASGSVTNVTSLNNLTDVTATITASGTILQIGTDGGPFLTSLPIDSDTLAGNSSTSIHSGESLKAYIDTQDTSGTITLSNKTFDLDANTLTGTLTEFNTALQGDSFVSLTGSETLTNKTLTSPVITNITGAGITLDSSADINFDADGADIILKDGGTEFGRFTNSSGELVIKSGSSSTAALTMSGANITMEGNAQVDGNLTVTGTTTFNGVTLGDAATDTIAFGGTITGSLTFEGSTDDSFETTLTPGNPSSDITLTLPSSASDTLVGKATTDTLTNKSIDLDSNTLSGTLGEFNTALQGDSFVSLTGSETLTNKQLTSPTIAEIVGTGGIELDAVQDITLDAGGGDVFLKDDGTTFGSLTNSSGELIVKSGTTTALTFSGANLTAAGNVTVSGNLTVSGTTTTVDSSTINIQNAFVFEGATADSFETTLTTVDPTADRTISLPNATTTLVGKDTTDTLTNKTLTTPVIAEIDSNSSITLDAATDIILDAGEQDIILKDDGTEFGRFSNSSGQLVIKSSSSSTAALTMSGANVQVEGNLTVVGTSSTQGSTITLGNSATDTIALTGTITGSLVFEGSTDDSFETTLTPGNPSSDITLTLPSSASDTLVGKATTDTLTNKSIDLDSNTVSGSLTEFNTALQGDSFVSLTGSETLTNKTLTSPALTTPAITGNTTTTGNIIFEGSTADSFETTLTVTDPTADRTVTLPNATDTLVGKATTDTLTNKTLTSPVVSGLNLSDSSIIFEGSSSNSFETTLTVTNPTADRTITIQDGSGTLAFLTDVTGGGAAGSFTTLATTGNVTLGDANSDQVVFNAQVNSHIIPAANDTYDLGSATKRWRTLFLAGETINLGGATISSDGTGTIAIAATGATLPAGSKVGASAIASAEVATGKAIRVVPFFKKGNLSTKNVDFTFAASGNLNYVFRNFTKNDGSALTAQEEVIFLF